MSETTTTQSPKAFTMEPFGDGTFRRRITTPDKNALVRGHELCLLIGMHSSDRRTKELAEIMTAAGDELMMRYSAATPSELRAILKRHNDSQEEAAKIFSDLDTTVTEALTKQSPGVPNGE